MSAIFMNMSTVMAISATFMDIAIPTTMAPNTNILTTICRQVLIRIRQKKYNIADGCHCFGLDALAMTALITCVAKIMANWYEKAGEQWRSGSVGKNGEPNKSAWP